MVRPLDSRSDQVLLDAYVRDGDADALASLVMRHVPRSYRLVRALSGCSPETAQRVVHECWVEVLAQESPALADVPVVEQVRDVVAVRALALGTGHPPAEPAGRLERAVALVPAEVRVVFVLHDAGGLTPEEIARLLRRPVSQVKVELWHARLAVQTLLGAEGGAERSAEEVRADDARADEARTEDLGATWTDPVPPTLVDGIVAALAGRIAPRRAEKGGSPISRLLGGGLAAAALILGSLLLARAQIALRAVDAPVTGPREQVATPWLPRVAGVVVSAVATQPDSQPATGVKRPRFAPPATAIAPTDAPLVVPPDQQRAPGAAVADADGPLVIGALARTASPASAGSADAAPHSASCPNRPSVNGPAEGALLDRPDG